MKNEIKKLAKALPKTYHDMEAKRELLGSQLISAGVTKLANGEKVNPNGKYLMPIGKQEVNYEKILKKLVKTNDKSRVENYIDSVLDLSWPTFHKVGDFILGFKK